MNRLSPEQRLKRDRAILTVFVIRQVTSLVILTIIAVQALQLPDRRLGMVFTPVVVGFAGWVVFQSVRFTLAYRARRERVRSGGGAA